MYIHATYMGRIKDLNEFLRKLSPDELITVTESTGYTIIWKSNKQHDWR